MGNWINNKEAKKKKCPLNGQNCWGEHCGFWVLRPCYTCAGKGFIMLKNNLCTACKGEGHDKTGFGKCGLARL